MKPGEIEDLSFKIIDDEAGDHNLDEKKWSIVRRMIHTSADFEYINTVFFHQDGVEKGIEAIRSGRNIVTDTNMALSGIRKKTIEKLGGQVKCFVDDPVVCKKALESGETRSRVALDAAKDVMNGGIYVVGNAPTALMRLLDLIKDNKVSPALVVGFPVGFVNAAESKEMLVTSGFPSITNVGRKGGSNIAASVINALIILATE